MAKFTISRLFEVSKYMKSQSGRDLKDALSYISEFVEVTTRCLRNGLTFTDNFNTQQKIITIVPDTETIVFNSNTKRVREVVIRRVVDDTYYIVSSFGWKYNSQGEVLVKVGFSGSPPSTQNINVEIMLHFE